jgi:hypothetical protein
MFGMLAEYGGRMRPDDEVQLAELNDCVTAFGAELLSAGTFVKTHKAAHAAKLSAEVAGLLASVKEVAEELASGRFDKAGADASEARAALAQFTEQARCCLPLCCLLRINGSRCIFGRKLSSAAVVCKRACGAAAALRVGALLAVCMGFDAGW